MQVRIPPPNTIADPNTNTMAVHLNMHRLGSLLVHVLRLGLVILLAKYA